MSDLHMSDYLRNSVMDHLFGNTPYRVPALVPQFSEDGAKVNCCDPQGNVLVWFRRDVWDGARSGAMKVTWEGADATAYMKALPAARPFQVPTVEITAYPEADLYRNLCAAYRRGVSLDDAISLARRAYENGAAEELG